MGGREGGGITHPGTVYDDAFKQWNITLQESMYAEKDRGKKAEGLEGTQSKVKERKARRENERRQEGRNGREDGIQESQKGSKVRPPFTFEG